MIGIYLEVFEKYKVIYKKEDMIFFFLLALCCWLLAFLFSLLHSFIGFIHIRRKIQLDDNEGYDQRKQVANDKQQEAPKLNSSSYLCISFFT